MDLRQIRRCDKKANITWCRGWHRGRVIWAPVTAACLIRIYLLNERKKNGLRLLWILITKDILIYYHILCALLNRPEQNTHPQVLRRQLLTTHWSYYNSIWTQKTKQHYWRNHQSNPQIRRDIKKLFKLFLETQERFNVSVEI